MSLLNRGIGIGLVISGVPIITSYILYQYLDNTHYNLSLFIVYTAVTIMGFLIILSNKRGKRK